MASSGSESDLPETDSDDERGIIEDSSSSEDESMLNTVGNVPMKWYENEDHIGYDREGNRIARKLAPSDRIDSFLAGDDPKAWRTVYDEYNDEKVTMTPKEVEMLTRLEKGMFPHSEFDQYAPAYKMQSDLGGIHPLDNGTEPKARFVPSKWEAKQVIKLIRAMRAGRIKPPETEEERERKSMQGYLLWGDDDRAIDESTMSRSQRARKLMQVAAPKVAPPGHAESYNPSKEYLPSEEELMQWQSLEGEDKPYNFTPTAYSSLRAVPMYQDFVKERFERCLDLYLVPRTKRTRLNIDPESLVPKLPKPSDLRPFPTAVGLTFASSHDGRVRSMSVDPTGQWLASGGDDTTVRLWEIATGRQVKLWSVGTVVQKVVWNPNPEISMIAIAAGNRLLFIIPGKGVGRTSAREAAVTLLQPRFDAPATAADGEASPAVWENAATTAAALAGMDDQSAERSGEKHAIMWDEAKQSGIALAIRLTASVGCVAWHPKGDYVSSSCSSIVKNAVLIHKLSVRGRSQSIKPKGRAQCVAFHPLKPYFFLATQHYVRVYDLMKQTMKQKLETGVKHISSLSIHGGGDNLLVGSYDKRLCWFDTDLSTRPYRILRSHRKAIRSVAFHPNYPLCASCSDDGQCHVYHAKVFDDLMQNPLIVPVKVLKAGGDEGKAVLDCVFHPNQPWIIIGREDGKILLYVNMH